jgi:hypothetical protein
MKTFLYFTLFVYLLAVDAKGLSTMSTHEPLSTEQVELLQRKDLILEKLEGKLKSHDEYFSVGLDDEIYALWIHRHPKAKDWHFKSKVRLTTMVEVISLLYHYQDKSFDFSKMPQTKVGLPFSKKGSNYGTGIDPNSIKEPDLRAEYIRLNREANAHSTKFSHERKLQKTEKSWVLRFTSSAYGNYVADGKSSLDKATASILKAVVDNARASNEVKSRLKHIVQMLTDCHRSLVSQEMDYNDGSCSNYMAKMKK